MADITPQEKAWQYLFGTGGSKGTNVYSGNAPASLSQPPPTNSPMGIGVGIPAMPGVVDPLTQGPRNIPMEVADAYYKSNAAPGIELDTASGGPASDRFSLGWLRDETDRLKSLTKKYPGMVRLSTDGKPIVRITDEATGKARDVLFDERGASAKDLLDIAHAIPEVAASMGSFFLAKRVGLGRVGQSVSSAIGGQAGGAAMDVAARTAHDLPVRPTEIASQRLKGVGMDVGLDALLAGSGGILKGTADTAMGYAPRFLVKNQGEAQRLAIESAKAIKDQFGIEIPLSVAEQTGSKMLAKIEGFAENVQGGPIKKLRGVAEEKMRQAQESLLRLFDPHAGPLNIPTGEEVGNRALTALQAHGKLYDDAVTGAKEATVRASTDEILSTMDKASLPNRLMEKRDIGAAVRQRALAMREDFQKTGGQLYENVWKLPGGKDRIFPGTHLAAEAKKLLSTLPPSGNQVSKEFVPPDVVGRLNEIIANPKTKRSLADLKQMRTDVDNAIAQGEAIPGVQTHYLGRVRKLLSDEMERVTSSIPDGRLKAAWKKANDHYATGRGKFDTIGVAELFKEGDVPGRVGDAQIVGKVLGTAEQANDRYFIMKEFLGQSSQEWKMLKRAMLDDIYEASLDSVSGRTLDAGKLLNRVDSLDREIRRDLLGGLESDLRASASVLGAAQGKVPVEVVDKLVGSRPLSAGNLHAAIRAEAARDKEYKKGIMQAIKSGGDIKIKPDEFVDRFLSLAGKEEVDEAVAILGRNPGLMEDIRRKAIEGVFLKAKRQPTPSDIVRGLHEDPTQILSGKALLSAMGNSPDDLRKLRAVLGDDAYNTLVHIGNITAAQGARDALAGSSGSLANQNFLIKLVTQPGAASMEYLAKVRLVSALIASPQLRKLTSMTHTPADLSRITDAVIYSTPVLRSLQETYGDEEMPAVNLKPSPEERAKAFLQLNP